MLLAAAEMVEGPLWVQIVYAAMTALVALLLVPYLKRKAEAAKAETLEKDLSARNLLLSQLKIFLLDEAAIIAEEKFPRLAKDIAAQGLKAPAIKQRLKGWGNDLRNRAENYFAVQGLDLVAAVGDEYLDRSIRWAADRMSPFPGKETAVTLLEEKWSNQLMQYGVNYVRDNYLSAIKPKTEEGGE